MYLDYFGLSAPPFSIATDPHFLYLSAKHREALAHLVFSTTHTGGFVVLTGEIGAGKTTLCRHFLDSIHDQAEVAFIFNPRVAARELLAAICKEFHIPLPGGKKNSLTSLTEALNHRLLEIHSAGKQALLVIDEAQNLSEDLLEQIRLLTNLETAEAKLLQIILIGQPQLQTLLRSPQLVQLSQRIVARYHLAPLSPPEVADYIRHRLAVAGTRETLFTPRAVRQVARLSQGVPRLVNVICDRALLGAYVGEQRKITPHIVNQAAAEIQDLALSPVARYRVSILLFTLTISVGLLAWLQSYRLASAPAPASPHASIQSHPTPLATPWLQGQLHSTQDAMGSRDAALRSLLQAWDITPQPGHKLAHCLDANQYGLQCFADRDNWRRMIKFNRPALLSLKIESGAEFFATLLRIEGNTAVLAIDGQTFMVGMQEIAMQWTGEYSLLWRPPSAMGQTPFHQLNTQPPALLVEQLGVYAPHTPLIKRVRGFQQRHGLPADGVIGIRTLIMLGMLNDSGPRLQPD